MKNKPSANLLDKLALLLIFLITVVLYLRLGRDYLFDWDEGIYATLGVEMIESKSIFTPSWNNELWFEKPPGIAWVSAASISLFGHNSFGARAFMPLFAALTLYCIYKIAVHLKSHLTGIFSILTLANFDLFLSRSRGLNADGPLLAFMSLAVYLSLIQSSVVLIAIALSLGIWVKGIAGLFALLIIAPLYFNKLREFLKICVLTLFISLPWHLFALIKYGATFITPYFSEQVLRRATIAVEYHVGNRWFYLTYLIESIGVGILILSATGFVLLFLKFAHDDKKNLSILLPIWWFGIIIFVITLFKTKLVWYSLPLLPPIAIGVAYLLSSLAARIKFKPYLVILIILFTLETLLHLTRSVEVMKSNGVLTDRVRGALYLNYFTDEENVAVLVPKIERVFSEIMPLDQRLSSSFRYGGMPNLLFYLEKPASFYYSEQDFMNYWDSESTHPYALVPNEDLTQLPDFSAILFESDDFLVIKRTDLYIINKFKLIGIREDLSEIK